MKANKVKIIVLAGLLAFVSIIIIQVYWLKQAFDYEERKFSQNIQVSLLEVCNELNNYYGYPSPLANPVEKLAKDYYVVNLRNDFDAKVLELFLVKNFREKGLSTNFEYAIYDCETDAMMYGNYVNLDKAAETKVNSNYFPKAHNLVYYFAVRFPSLNSFIYASLKGWIILCMAMVVVLAVYLYAIYIILQQQKFAALQRDFINNMSHEFKTPLSSILIASGFLSKNEKVMYDEKLKQYTHIITEQGKKLDSHLEKILNIARQDSGPLQLNREKIKVTDYIKPTIETIQLKYPDAVVTVNDQLTQPFINADAFHFANVLYNFLDNSIKYCIQKPTVKIDLQNSSGNVVMTITDNGVGIAAKHLKHVFEKFYRAPQSNKLSVNGFGLGLYYVKKICDLHRWKLTIDSQPDKGTVITLAMKAM